MTLALRVDLLRPVVPSCLRLQVDLRPALITQWFLVLPGGSVGHGIPDTF